MRIRRCCIASRKAKYGNIVESFRAAGKRTAALFVPKIKKSAALHDMRHIFVTIAKEAGVNERVLKIIVGHAVQDITEKIYTHRKIEQMHEEINTC